MPLKMTGLFPVLPTCFCIEEPFPTTTPYLLRYKYYRVSVSQLFFNAHTVSSRALCKWPPIKNIAPSHFSKMVENNQQFPVQNPVIEMHTRNPFMELWQQTQYAHLQSWVSRVEQLKGKWAKMAANIDFANILILFYFTSFRTTFTR
jgi:hypothetical protein